MYDRSAELWRCSEIQSQSLTHCSPKKVHWKSGVYDKVAMTLFPSIGSGRKKKGRKSRFLWTKYDIKLDFMTFITWTPHPSTVLERTLFSCWQNVKIFSSTITIVVQLYLNGGSPPAAFTAVSGEQTLLPSFQLTDLEFVQCFTIVRFQFFLDFDREKRVYRDIFGKHWELRMFYSSILNQLSVLVHLSTNSNTTLAWICQISQNW